MSYLPHTEADREAMQAAIGVESIQDLFHDVPEAYRYPVLDLPKPMSEMEIMAEMEAMSEENLDAGHLTSFLGALFDDIFIDGRLERTIAIVEAAIEQSEKQLKHVRTRRGQLHRKLQRTESTRVSLFQRLGEEHKGRVGASS